ncbi:hypothetical protein HK405_011136, partial [Cladochytrium tenue]
MAPSPPLPPSPVTPPVLMPLPLDALPDELLDQVLLRVGPRPSHLLPCLTASRRMHAAAARALCAAIRFESVRQRAAFARLAAAAAAITSSGADGLSDDVGASGGRSLAAPCGLTPAAIARRLVALDFGLRPAEATSVPVLKIPKGGRRLDRQQHQSRSDDGGGGGDNAADGAGGGGGGGADSKVEMWPRVDKAATTASSVMVAADYNGAAAAGSDPSTATWSSAPPPEPAGHVVVTAAGPRRRSAATIPVPLFLARAAEPSAVAVGASMVAELPPPVAPAADFDDGMMRRERRASSSSAVSSASSSSTLSTFSSSSSSSSAAAYGSRWDHRFVGHDLSLLLCGGGLGSRSSATTAVCGAQLRYLSLSGCHVDDATVAEVLGRL